MAERDELMAILDRILSGRRDEEDIAKLRQSLSMAGSVLQLVSQDGKFNTNIGQITGGEVHLGDKIYKGTDANTIRAILLEVLPPQDKNPSSSLTQQDYRNRQILLNRVDHYWVKGCLEQSLYHHIQLDLGLQKRQDAVDLPWGTLAEPCRTLPQGTRIIEQFDSLGVGRRLLILGHPGAGKTTALLELAKDLIDRTKEDITLPIPVVFQLSTWKDPKQSLKEWLAAELFSKYEFPETISRTWIEAQQLLLLFDGLDEVRADRQADCIETINQFWQDYGQTEMVVCSRSNDYEQLPVRLRCDAALFIQPLNSQQIEHYLQLSGAKLQGIGAALKTDPLLADLAKTPLFLWIIFLAYEGVSAEELPQEQNADAQIKRLFNQYLNRMAEPPNKGQRYPYPHALAQTKKQSKQHKPSYTYSKEKTLEWLQVLARRTTQESSSIFLIEHIHPGWLPTTVSPWRYRLGVGLVAGLVMEWIYGLPLGLIGGMLSFQMLTGLLAGLSLGTLSSMNSEIKLFDSLGWSWSWERAFKAAKPALLSIPVISIITILMSMVSIDMGFFWRVGLGLITGVVSAIISGCLAGLVATQPKQKDDKVLTPNQGIWKSAQKSVGATLITLIIVILPVTFLCDYFVPVSVILGCISLYVGGLACLQHLTIRTLLWQTNSAPWDYNHFLNYAIERLLMKQAGGGYLFIHDLLRQNLAIEKKWRKLSWQSNSKRIILGVGIGMIFLLSILLPTVINSWTVIDQKTAQFFSPRIQVGDRLLTDRLSPRLGRLKQGDIITFKATAEMPEAIRGKKIKGEVIGCPGNAVNVHKGKILINGKPLINQYLNTNLYFRESPLDFVPNDTYLIASKYAEKSSFIVVKIQITSIEERAILKIYPELIQFIY